jgi:hypothetical protein
MTSLYYAIRYVRIPAVAAQDPAVLRTCVAVVFAIDGVPAALTQDLARRHAPDPGSFVPRIGLVW